MGEPKLLLPVAGRPLIEHTLEAWQRSQVDRIVVVIRPGDQALAVAVEEFCQYKARIPKSKVASVELVVPESAPPEMKASVQAALLHIERNFSPTAEDAFLAAPADMPGLSAAIVDRLIERHGTGTGQTKLAILAPTINGNRGHPTLFPWPLATEVFSLAENQGLNAIVQRHQPRLVPCEDLIRQGEYPFADVDTREEYRQITRDK